MSEHRGVVVIGSGFGASLAAWPLVHAGIDVLMVERGDRVERGPDNWGPAGTVMRQPVYTEGPTFVSHTDRGRREGHAYACVGGPSVYYGGVSLRYRESDFRPGKEIVTDSGAEWPFGYSELSPYYDEAERILSVAGRAGEDPTEPPRSRDYLEPPAELSEVSRRMAEAARKKGLRPFRLPLAINYSGANGRRGCIGCATCDTFACAIGAKNDVDAQILPSLVAHGMELRARTVAAGVLVDGDRAVGIECFDRGSGERRTVTADAVILAGGALGTAQLLLASGLEALNPAGDCVGRYLTRHCSGIVFGTYGWLPRYEGRYHKQIGINDFYHGDPDGSGPPGPLGNIQQTQTPDLGTVRGEISALATALVAPVVRRITGLLVLAEDRPRRENRVSLEPDRVDELGLPRLSLHHRYDDRDVEARRTLARGARTIHRAAGSLASYFHRIDTFSHALGTVRMGNDPATAPLDPAGRFRGVRGLYVSDGSALPTSAGVNPSLTIAANALRIGRAVEEDLRMAGKA